MAARREKRQEAADPISFASMFSAQKPIDMRLRRLDNAIACEMERIADLRDRSARFRETLVEEIEPYEWEIQGQIEAEKTARNLKSRPSETVLRLKATRFGLELLLDRWERLLYVQQMNRNWTEPQSRLALDLLGTPVEFRDGPNAIELGKGDELRQGLIKLVTQEIVRLKTFKNDHAMPRDARRFALAKSGSILLPDDSHKRLLAEIKECEKALKWATRERDRLLKILASQPNLHPVTVEQSDKPVSETESVSEEDSTESTTASEQSFTHAGPQLQERNPDSKDIYAR